MRVTVLAENTAEKEGIGSEHGLSLFIETKNERILFDMGQTDLFLQNARLLGVDLKSVDFAVLSHGHYDHGGGLPYFLAENEKAPVFISKSAFRPFYNGAEKYIGLEKGLGASDRFSFVRDGHSFGKGVKIFCAEGREGRFSFSTPSLLVLEEGKFVPDDFSHEIYLLVEEEGKKVLFSGCAHRGVQNILDWFSPDVFIGGFHLSKFPLDGNLLSLGEKLSKTGCELYTCHCTGREQYEFIKPVLPRLFYVAAGDCFEI